MRLKADKEKSFNYFGDVVEVRNGSEVGWRILVKARFLNKWSNRCYLEHRRENSL